MIHENRIERVKFFEVGEKRRQFGTDDRGDDAFYLRDNRYVQYRD